MPLIYLSRCGQSYPHIVYELYEKQMKACLSVREALSRKTPHFFQKIVDNVHKSVDKPWKLVHCRINRGKKRPHEVAFAVNNY